MQKLKILWVDDEIEHLKPFVIFLSEKGHKVTTVSNGSDAIKLVLKNHYDLVLLDEMMPGMDGLTTLKEIKRINSSLSVVMVTKNEEEDLMEDAIAGQIADYLIKPINPNQIILTIKKLFQTNEIKKNKIGADYARFSSELNEDLGSNPNWDEWSQIYQKLCDWDSRLDDIRDETMTHLHFLEKLNCNSEFSNYVTRNYKDWLSTDERPTFSFDLISEYVIPAIERENTPVYFIVLDCMRLDQYYTIEPFLKELFDVEVDLYYSILPTATPYSRNAIFSGLMPNDIAKNFPKYWTNSADLDTSRNRNEHQLLEEHLKDLGHEINESKYVKIFNIEEGDYTLRKIESWKNEKLIVLVYNFLDLLAHHRSQNQVLKEAIPDEEALRHFTKHWFTHSTFYETLKKIKEQNATVIITTDHGSIRVNRASQLIGNKETTSSVRNKQGKNLKMLDKHSFYLENPEEYGLPKQSIIENYVLAKEDYYFVYPNAFHKYMKQYVGTFQHGGISMEEMILPISICRPQK